MPFSAILAHNISQQCFVSIIQKKCGRGTEFARSFRRRCRDQELVGAIITIISIAMGTAVPQNSHRLRSQVILLPVSGTPTVTRTVSLLMKNVDWQQCLMAWVAVPPVRLLPA